MSATPVPPQLRELCHSLSQPLTVARCSLELALSLDAADPSRAGYFDDVLAALDRMTTVVAAIRDFSTPG